MNPLLARYTLAVAAVALVGFLLVAALVVAGATAGADAAALQAGEAARHGPVGTLSAVATELGYAPGFIGVAAIATAVVALRGWRRSIPLPLLVLIAADAANRALKCAFLRPRPEEDPRALVLLGCDRFAFPSGHAMDSAALYGLLIWWVLAIGGPRSMLAAFALALLPFWIGLSRVVLGVHWLSDVVGGWLAGLALASLAIPLWDALLARRRRWR